MKKTSSFLTGFLAILVAAGLLSSAGTAQAILVSINIGSSGFNIGGINGGVASGTSRTISNFPISGNNLALYNTSSTVGINTAGGAINYLEFATGNTWTTPRNFSLNDSIDSSGTWTSTYNYTVFKGTFPGDPGVPYVSPDFGAGSYMGFRTTQGNYGYLEVTWTASSNEFQILSGAYEMTPGVAIMAGAPVLVPEPGTWAAAALLAGGAGFMRWRKRAKVA